MTLKQLQALSSDWQIRLNLPEWTILTTWGRGPSMKKLAGRSWWHTEELRGYVEIAPRASDKEGTLVHELLHIVLQGHSELPEGYDVELERAINRITGALVKI